MGAGNIEDWRVAWTGPVDALDPAVAATAALRVSTPRAPARPPADPWQPPAGLGPLPLDLRPRADAILQRQLAVAEELARHLVANRQQSAMVSRIETGGARAGPAYLDCAM